MNEVAETPAAGAPADAATATPGQRLKAARERRGLSSQKAADQMHLDQWVIEALESGDYEKIGPSVYAKGHLKHYAAMLGLPAAEILAAYGAPPPAAAASAPAGMPMRAREPVGTLPWATIAAAVVAVAVIAGLVWLRPWHPRVEAASPAVAQTRPAASAPTAETADEGAVDETQDGGAAGATGAFRATAASDAETAPAVAAAVAAAVVTAPPPGGGKARLRLSFSADSWVEVHDAAGKSVFAGNGRANSVKTLAGDAPLRVYLGFASGVQLAINNRVVAIGPQFVAGDIARFEAGADGVLRRDTHSTPSSAAAPHEPHPRG